MKDDDDYLLNFIDDELDDYNNWLDGLDAHFVSLVKKNSGSITLALARLIDEKGGFSLNAIIKETGLCKQTAYNHLKCLVENKILWKSAIVKGRGRPIVIYARTKNPIKHLSNEIVSLSFEKLKSICAYNSRGVCGKNKELCSLTNCPNILK